MLKDWMTVFAYIDAHPDLPQERVVHYFKTKPQDALEFTQATLSRKLKDCQQLEQRINSHPKSDDEDISDDKPKLSTAELIGLCENSRQDALHKLMQTLPLMSFAIFVGSEGFCDTKKFRM